ncbi:glutaminyl-peptide cyclotransferase [Candidatus Bathyarchaeota archaeon]|nr:glutaminyl-peptide cyclotransferase [Candidatus Bathyarchaeota archaeon]
MGGAARRKGLLFAALVLFLLGLQFAYQSIDAAEPVFYTFNVVDTYPHDESAFTQGFVYHGGLLYEGTGLYGRSSLRITELSTGDFIEQVNLPSDLFGEGITILGDRLYQVTWQENTGFVYSLDLAFIDTFTYDGEGWGLTHDGEHLVLSNGSSTLSFLDPGTFQVVRTVDVTYDDEPVSNLNELEYVDGVIYANIWQTDRIVMIDPEDGAVVGWIDLEGLEEHLDSTEGINVLNGIAYNEESGRLLVTGKLWTNVFEIELIPE